MTREERLKHCTICTHQKFDMKLGTVCDLTDQQADFEISCPSFELDESKRHQAEVRKANPLNMIPTASMGKRFVNYLIDALVFLALTYMLGFVISIVLLFVAPDMLNNIAEGKGFVDYLITYSIYFIYDVFSEYVFGRSLGKLVTKTKVIDLNGNRPDFTTIVFRSLGRLIPFDALSYLGSDAVGWHDQVSKTRVVDVDFELKS